MITTEALMAFVISCATAGGIAVSNIDEVKSAFTDIKAQEFNTVCEAKSFAFPEFNRASFVTNCMNRSMAQFQQRVGASWNVSSN